MNLKSFTPLLLLITFTSCSCKQFKLTSEERNWCSYKNNEMLIFKSQKGNVDTLEVSNKIERYTNEDCNFEVSTKQLNSLDVNLSLKSKKKTLLVSYVTITKNGDGNESYPELSFFGLTSDLRNYKFIEETVRLTSTNKIYKNVYFIEDGKNSENVDSGYLDSFYYDKKFGLIKYQAKDGETFELFKRL